jgi:hypothetical protein
MPRLLLALSFLAAPLTAIAQSEDEEPARPIVYAKEYELDFEALRLTAEAADDGLEYVVEPKRADFHPFITLRRDFNAELAASIDEVK